MSDWKKIGVCGVDAGLLWLGDPCYVVSKDASHVFETWEDFCKSVENMKESQQFNYEGGHPGLGVCVHTCWGDGEYPVYAKFNSSGRLSQVKVVFESEEGDEDFGSEENEEEENG